MRIDYECTEPWLHGLGLLVADPYTIRDTRHRATDARFRRGMVDRRLEAAGDFSGYAAPPVRLAC